MSDKKAFIFDTNFIVQNKNFEKIVDELSDNFVVYITQVSIDERISQQCRELKKQFDDAEKARNTFKDFATISFFRTYEDREKQCTKAVQTKYETKFGDKIIPFLKNEEMFLKVLDRANRKTAPFLSEDNASDKGFKDAIIWESILEYFAAKGEKEVVFVTNDNGFHKNADFLCSEFNKKTGKTISIHLNEFYKELLKQESEDTAQEQIQKSSKVDLNEIRERIKSAMERLCYRITYNYNWDDTIEVPTFEISKEVDTDYVSNMFYNMEWVYNEHILETELWASQLMDLDDRFKDGEERIEISVIEDLLRLKRQIQENASDYIQQFYAAVASIMNQRYVEMKDNQTLYGIDEDDLPF